ncbi:MAG: hypothetical protein PHG66_01150 [Candidatus Colwellbacteria bacterium]|nr:hypothetical protein [Candidatus Colwellbacteria bacterium]
MFECEFCGKGLSSKQNLRTHQLKTKYCLEKQALKSGIILQNESLHCQYCNKSFTYLCNKTTHENTCPEKEIQLRISVALLSQKDKYETEISSLKDKYETEISSLKEIITSLKIEQCKSNEKAEIYTTLFNKEQEFTHNQSSKLIDKSGGSVTNNIKAKNITMNSLNLSQERLEAIKDTYTIKHYERGGIGQADWVVDNVIRDESGTLIYKCTDKNRKNFIYHDDKGNIVTDIQAKKLKEAILPIMNTKLKEFKKIKCAELAEISDDESELLEKYSDLYNENRSMGNEFDKRLIEKTYDK